MTYMHACMHACMYVTYLVDIELTTWRRNSVSELCKPHVLHAYIWHVAACMHGCMEYKIRSIAIYSYSYEVHAKLPKITTMTQ